MNEPARRDRAPRHMQTEQGVLRISIAATGVVATLGIVFGLLSGSYAIVFDGIYSLADGATSVVALLVANLIASYNASDESNRRLVEKFTMGFWHLEPMVVGATGLLMSGAAVYAFINAIGSFMSGGRPLQFSQAIVYAAVTTLISLAMAWYGRRANRRIRSELVAMDARGWLMSTAITAALLVAFVLGLAIQGTALEWMSPYIDPAVLALVCLVVFPIPLRAVRQALEEVLMVTPMELKRQVDEVGSGRWTRWRRRSCSATASSPTAPTWPRSVAAARSSCTSSRHRAGPRAPWRNGTRCATRSARRSAPIPRTAG